MNFIKANLWKLLAMVVVVYFMVMSYNTLRDYLFNAGMAAAKADYDENISAANARIEAQNKNYVNLIGEAERKRQETKITHEAEIAKYKNDVKYFRSETAVALKAKNATIEQWAAAKTQDEIIIGLATDRIEVQDKQIKKMIAEHGQVIADLNTAHKAIVDDMAMKFQRCQEWSDKLEAKVKKKLGIWRYIGKAAERGAWFMLGRASI